MEADTVSVSCTDPTPTEVKPQITCDAAATDFSTVAHSCPRPILRVNKGLAILRGVTV